MRRNSSNRERSRLLALAVAAALAAPGVAWADDFVFTAAGGGDWNTSGNWTPPGPPGATGRADIAGGRTVTIAASPASPVDTLYLGGNVEGPSPNDNATSNTTGSGTLNQTAGDLVVNTYATLGENSATGAQAANSGAGTYNLSGGTFTLNGSTTFDPTLSSFSVGQGGTGAFNITGSAAVTINNNVVNLGRWSGAAGDTHAEQGRGNGTIVQGGNSTFTINISATPNVNTFALDIGLNGDGTYTLKDNATLTSSLDVNVGTNRGSTGILNQSGGTLKNTGGWFYVANQPGSTGTYNLSGGTTTITNRFLVGAQGNGTVNQTGGTISVGSTGGASDDFALGDAGGTAVYNLSGGTANANDGLFVGEWNNANGTLNVSGTGTVNTTDLGVARNDPKSDPTTIKTTGVVNQTGGTVNVKGKVYLGLDGGMNSNGNTTGTYNLSGGQLNLGTGGLQLGGMGQTNPGATGIFNLKGAGILEASRGTLQIGAGAGATTAFNMTGGTLRNAAAISFPLNQQGGTLQPGDPGAPATTAITGDGTTAYKLASAGTLHVEIASGVADQLQVSSGATTLAGSLDVLLSGTRPRHTASFAIISSDGMTGDEISGAFSNAASQYASPQGLFHVSYSPTAVTLSGFSLPGDANEDGKVDFTDLVILARNYGKTGATWDQGDFDQDMKVDFGDLVALARNYGQNNLAAAQLAQLPPTVRADVQAAFAEVPEPATPAIIALGAAALLARRSRRRNPRTHSAPPRDGRGF